MKFSWVIFHNLLVYICSSTNSLKEEVLELRCDDDIDKVYTIDQLIPPEELELLNELMETEDQPWILRGNKREDIEMSSEVSWTSPISPNVFQDFSIWKRLAQLLKEHTAISYYICHAMFTVSYRMDFNPISKDEGHNLTVRIFLNNDIKKNHYGEHAFYTKNTSDVLCAIYPAPGRILVCNSSVSYCAKPPSMLFLQSQDSVVIKLTDSPEKHKTCQDQFDAKNKEYKIEDFPFTKGQPTELQSIKHGINFDNHLTNKYFDSHGYEIAVFDNILLKKDLDILREYLIKDYSLHRHPYDTDKTEDNDNVAWILMQKVDVLVQSELWKIIKAAVKYLSGSDEWYPYDVSMNIVHSFDHTRIHEDCEKHEYEYTFLLYLNPEWKGDFYGETMFYDLVNSSTNVTPGDEEYEVVAAVLPRYGRVALFRGIIPHSARPPSPRFKGPRYTFACKVSKTYQQSLRKQLQETLENIEGEDRENGGLMEQLLTGELEAKEKTIDFWETELAKQKQMVKKQATDSQREILEKLSYVIQD